MRDKLNILLVEDEPVSAQFLIGAISGFGHVAHADTVATARTLLGAERFDLLLVDARLPDGDALDVLESARNDELGRQRRHGPALALTAEPDAQTCARLCTAGFVECLGKPITRNDLAAHVRKHVGMPAAAIWDDAAAARALGPDPAAIAALRKLMLTDLPQQRARIEAAAARLDAATLREELHRLKAACAFCGASALAAAIEALQAAVDATSLGAFQQACDDLLA